jgi:hypothetical protein
MLRSTWASLRGAREGRDSTAKGPPVRRMAAVFGPAAHWQGVAKAVGRCVTKELPPWLLGVVGFPEPG